MRRFSRFGVAACVIVLATFVGIGPSSAATEYRNVSWNVCLKGNSGSGSQCYFDNADSFRISRTASFIKEYTPYIVGFQEVCESNLIAIRQSLASTYGYQMYSFFAQTQTIDKSQVPGNSCFYNTPTGTTQAPGGIGILIRRVSGTGNPITTTFATQNGGGENRKQICVDALSPDSLVQRACTVHLDNDSAGQYNEIAQSFSDFRQAGRALSINGDFNYNCRTLGVQGGTCSVGTATADNLLANLYNQSFEADSFDSVDSQPNSATNDPRQTTRRKIDYSFNGYSKFASNGSRAVIPSNDYNGVNIADHLALISFLRQN